MRSSCKNLTKSSVYTLCILLILGFQAQAQQKPLPKIGFIENLGKTINSEHPEYSAVLTNDHRTIMFTTKRPENKGSLKGKLKEEILVSRLNEQDEWEEPERLKGLATSGNDATVQLFANDKKMIIYQKNDLLVTELVNGKWTKPSSIGKAINKPNNRESHGFITSDGQTLIFSSDFKSKKGDLNLFMAKKQRNGEWGEPRPLNEINTDFDEDAPFIDEEGILYFSSKGHGSKGGFDIYRSVFNPQTQKYGKPENLGDGINTKHDEIFFNVKNEIAYFTSNRPGGVGAEDIYRAYLFTELTMEGELVSSINNNGLGGYRVEITVDGKVYRANTNASGFYSMKLPNTDTYQIQVSKDGKSILQENFKPRLNMKNPALLVHNFMVDEQQQVVVGTETIRNERAQPVKRMAPAETKREEPSRDLAREKAIEEMLDIMVPPSRDAAPATPPRNAPNNSSGNVVAIADVKVQMDNRAKKSLISGQLTAQVNGKPLAGRVEILDPNTRSVLAVVDQTSASGKFSIMSPQLESFVVRGVVAGYTSEEKLVNAKGSTSIVMQNTSRERDEAPARVSNNQQDIFTSDLTSGMRYILKNIYFETNEADLNYSSKKELDLIAELFHKNPDLKVEISGHTDSLGEENFNLWLSQQRANVVMEYLLSKNVKRSQLTAVGYGQKQPLASNDDEKEGREINRRIEMKILSRGIVGQ
jgi:outer membrane protein OmpA-like peptidoglycan-associated protein